MKLTNTNQRRWWLVAVTLAAAFGGATPAFAQQCGNPNQRGADIQGGAVRSNVPDFDAASGGGYLPHVETFNASPSSRPSQGPGVTYSWSQDAGGTAGTFSTTTGGSTLFTVPDIGPAGEELTVRLTITSTLAACPGSWTDTVKVQVIDFYTVVSNNPPDAIATATPATVDEGEPVTLSAAGSSDPDGDPLTYSWVQTDGVPVSLAGANTATASFSAPNTAYPSGDTLEFELTVFDGTFSDVAPVTVNVTWVNDSPVAALSCPSSVNERTNIALDGSASSDADDGIASYRWTGGWSTLDLSGYAANAISVPAKTLEFHEWPFFEFTLTTTDATGAYTFDECTVQILDVTAPEIVVPQPPTPGEPAIVQEADSAAGAAVLFEPQVSAMDNFDGHLTYGSASFDCAPASGSVFPLGGAPAQGTTTPVTCSATDSAGNSSDAGFDVRVQDTTAPSISVPASIAVEATGPGGATVDYGTIATADAVDGAGIAVCSPASNTVFPLGVTVVDCDAEDARLNKRTASFEVAVHDTTPPVITVPGPITAEATSPQGAAVDFSVSAFDLVDEDVPVTCTRQSGDVFPLGATIVGCSATDAAGNTGNSTTQDLPATFTVTVVDTTPPTLALPGDLVAEATSGDGAVVTFAATASDIVDVTADVACLPASGSQFALGVTPVNCSATDHAGNTATGNFTIKVQDTTPPALTLPLDQVVEATSAAGATVNFAASALDIVDGNVAAACTPAPGSTFPLAPAPTQARTTLVECEASDAAGNTGHGSFKVTVQDTTGPQIDQPDDIGPVDATGADGALVSYDSPATHDSVDGNGVASCTPLSGTRFALGTTTVTCNAIDARMNAATPVSFDVVVQYPWNGFFRPIDNLPTVNSVKAGSAVPVKFILGGNMGLAIFAQGYPRAVMMQCSGGALEDVIEETVTAGGSTLTYDTGSGQYVYVWKTDKAWAGSCRQLQLKLADDTLHVANFKFTK